MADRRRIRKRLMLPQRLKLPEVIPYDVLDDDYWDILEPQTQLWVNRVRAEKQTERHETVFTVPYDHRVKLVPRVVTFETGPVQKFGYEVSSIADLPYFKHSGIRAVQFRRWQGETWANTKQLDLKARNRDTRETAVNSGIRPHVNQFPSLMSAALRAGSASDMAHILAISRGL